MHIIKLVAKYGYVDAYVEDKYTITEDLNRASTFNSEPSIRGTMRVWDRHLDSGNFREWSKKYSHTEAVEVKIVLA